MQGPKPQHLSHAFIQRDHQSSHTMQNRLVLTRIPPLVPPLPHAAESLRDLIEEHGCWVDRFAFLCTSDDDADDVIAAAELHIENVRDDAVRSLDRLTVTLDESGCRVLATKENQSNTRKSKDTIQFQIRAAPATSVESKQLVDKCHIKKEDNENTTGMKNQTLFIPINDISLTVRCDIEKGGGTGSTPWRGGLLLSQQICHWHEAQQISVVDFNSLFCDKIVLELGAGCSGLPSMTLAKIATTFHYDTTIISSDGVDEIVDTLRSNVKENRLCNFIKVEHVDWNDYGIKVEGRHRPTLNCKVDTIMFADCIYNERCAVALSSVILSLIKPNGYVIGVIPNNRVGPDVFERCMKQKEFRPVSIPIIFDVDTTISFACTGGGGKDYRLLLFRQN